MYSTMPGPSDTVKSNTGRSIFIKTFTRMFLPSVLLIIILMLIVQKAMVPLIENIYIEQKKELCRDLVDVAINELEKYNSGMTAGGIGLKAAQVRAKEMLNNFTFKSIGADYFWVIDQDFRIVVHPDRGEIERLGVDRIRVSDDMRLSDLFRQFKKLAAEEGGGYTDYNWFSDKRPDTMVRKITYVRGFRPWGWIIGTGVLLDHIDDGVREWKHKSFFITLLMTVIAVIFSFALSFNAVKHQKRELEALNRLSLSEKQFRSVYYLSPVGMCILRSDNWEFVAANPAFSAITGFSEDEISGKTPFEVGIIYPVGENADILGIMSRLEPVRDMERRIKTKDGDERTVIVSSEVLNLEQFEFPCAILTIMDITENRRLLMNNGELKDIIQKRTAELINLDIEVNEKALRIEQIEKQLSLATNIFENVSESVVITNRDGEILSVNQAFTFINGYTQDEVLGRNPRILKSDRQDVSFYKEMWKSIIEEHYWKGEIWNRRKNGEAYPARLSITAVTDLENNITHCIGVTRDVTDLQRSRDELNFAVFHDVLTGLPNRYLFTDRLSMACLRAEAAGGRISVLMIGLDRFSAINTALGYPAGDSILQETGKRLKEFFRENGNVARFGGDEFIGMVSFNEEIIYSVRIADELLALFKRPYEYNSEVLYINASIGMAIFPQDGTNSDELIRNALIAMERAKSEGKNRYSYFTGSMDLEMLNRLRLETDIRNGIDSGEFTVYFQPKIDTATENIRGMEALMRWFPEPGRTVSPAEFISVAEETGEISRLGELALNRSCMINAGLYESGHRLKVAVNVSPRQFFEYGFITTVEHSLEVSGLNPSYLELEITESTVMRDIRESVRIMETLRSKGVTFSLDDFGTGYSSLSHIKNLPLSGVKIDSSFTRDVAINSETRAIINALASMCRDLKLELTIEGIETPEQLEMVKLIAPGALIQGYYYSRPLDIGDFRDYLKRMSDTA